MAYQTGTVNDFVALRTELFNFAQAQGYTLIGGKMLQKGDVYAEFEASTTAWLRMRGGTGEDGSGNPTGAPHNRYAYLMDPAFGINFTWPITYLGGGARLEFGMDIAFLQHLAADQRVALQLREVEQRGAQLREVIDGAGLVGH